MRLKSGEVVKAVWNEFVCASQDPESEINVSKNFNEISSEFINISTSKDGPVHVRPLNKLKVALSFRSLATFACLKHKNVKSLQNKQSEGAEKLREKTQYETSWVYFL